MKPNSTHARLGSFEAGTDGIQLVQLDSAILHRIDAGPGLVRPDGCNLPVAVPSSGSSSSCATHARSSTFNGPKRLRVREHSQL